MEKLKFRKIHRITCWLFVISALFFSCVGTKNFERIDTHIHLCDTYRKGGCEFLDSITRKNIYYPHLVEDFIKTASPAKVRYAIVVEASFRREDIFWLAELVENENTIKAFIANLDPCDPYFIYDLDSSSHYKKFRGIRIRTITPIDLSNQKIIDVNEKRKLVSGIDLVPTILDYAGAQIPEELKGISLKKHISNPTANLHEFVVTGFAVDPFDKTLTGRMIRSSRYKHHVYSKDEKKEELFDMINEPLEMNNLAATKEYQSVKHQLIKQLKKWARATNDPFFEQIAS